MFPEELWSEAQLLGARYLSKHLPCPIDGGPSLRGPTGEIWSFSDAGSKRRQMLDL
jgi:hypothetical protein